MGTPHEPPVAEPLPSLDYVRPQTLRRAQPSAAMWVVAGVIWAVALPSLALTLWNLAVEFLYLQLPIAALWSFVAVTEAWAIFRRSTRATWLLGVPLWIATVVLVWPAFIAIVVGLRGEPLALGFLLLPAFTAFAAITHGQWADAISAERLRPDDAA